MVARASTPPVSIMQLKEMRVEVKHTHSRGNWNHTLDEIDYIVCWENRWKDFPKPVK